MKLKIWEIALIAALIFTVIFGSNLNEDAQALSDKLIRLHVVANSDSDSDQELKLKVRDAVLETLEYQLEGITDSDEAASIISGQLDSLRAVAEKTIEQNGYDYTVKVSLCQEAFPTTEYDTFSLPAGVYESLRVVIGDGNGHNWWCVVFPPVCTAPVLDESTADAVGLTGEEVSLMTAESGGYLIKFKFLELLGKLKSLFI